MTASAVPAPAATPTAKSRVAFIDIGRGLGALLVVYSHIAEPWVRDRGNSAPYISFVDRFTSVPMHMTEVGIGQIAVPFFFLVSGFVVTPIALRNGQYRFFVNRAVRVYLPIALVVGLTVLGLTLSLNVPTTDQSHEITPLTLLTNLTLSNYLISPQVVFIPVAWSMIVEIIFYALLLVMVPVFRRAPWLALAIEITLVFVVLVTRSAFGPSWSLFAVNVSYLPIMLIGQVIWAATTKRIPTWAAGVLGGLAWMLFVFGDILELGRPTASYSLALAVAVLCFLLGLFAEPKLKQSRFWTALSERSYSIYLLHMLVTSVVLGALLPHVPFTIALIIAIAATFAVVELSYRLVEKPSHTLARRLSRPRPKPADALPTGRAADPAAALSAAEVTTEIARAQLPSPPRPRTTAHRDGASHRRPVRPMDRVPESGGPSAGSEREGAHRSTPARPTPARMVEPRRHPEPRNRVESSARHAAETVRRVEPAQHGMRRTPSAQQAERFSGHLFQPGQQ